MLSVVGCHAPDLLLFPQPVSPKIGARRYCTDSFRLRDLPTRCQRCVTPCVCLVPCQLACLEASDVPHPVFGVFEFRLALRDSDWSRGGTSQNVLPTRHRAYAGRQLLLPPKRSVSDENVRHTASLSRAKLERVWSLHDRNHQRTHKFYPQAFSRTSRDSLTPSTRMHPTCAQVGD